MFSKFGNKVKIKHSPQTDEKGLAGKIGEIYGQTTPSIIDIEIIGTPKEDYAVNVYFNDLKESFWFDAELLEQIDDGKGTVMTLGSKKWTKGKNGEWIEESIEINQSPTEANRRSRANHIFKALSLVSVFLTACLIISYFFCLSFLRNNKLSESLRLFIAWDFSGYLIILQFASVILLLTHAIIKKKRHLYFFLLLLLFVYFMFDIYFDNTCGSFNPV
jgi:hypothetical protein